MKINQTYLIYLRLLILGNGLFIFFIPYLDSDKHTVVFDQEGSFYQLAHSLYLWLLIMAYFFTPKLKSMLVAFGGFGYLAFLLVLSFLLYLGPSTNNNVNPENAQTPTIIGFCLFLIYYPLIFIEYLWSQKLGK